MPGQGWPPPPITPRNHYFEVAIKVRSGLYHAKTTISTGPKIYRQSKCTVSVQRKVTNKTEKAKKIINKSQE
jgi:tRNA G26 N,N-dimethylase Trm1